MRHDPDALMIFAAGFGTRMGALTAARPKPLIEVAGHTLLDRALTMGTQANIAHMVVNTHYLGAQVAAHLAHRPDIAISAEADILETGGGLKAALPLLGAGPVMTLNPDAVWTGANPLTALRAAWDPERMDALLMLVPPEAARGYRGQGDFTRAPDGRLSRGPGYVYSGAQILKTDGLAMIEHDNFSLNLLWDQMLTQGRVHGLIHSGGWCDVGRPEGVTLAETMLADSAHV
ncbi:MAG: nucleotidyltransferase family protein [Celeribacter sp.]|jgi:MurNAc alpha-1-phosphate uridylyltransferase